MTATRAIGAACDKVILLIVRGLALLRIHPNVLTFLGLLVNVGAAAFLAYGKFLTAGFVIIAAGIDLDDECRVANLNLVTRSQVALENPGAVAVRAIGRTEILEDELAPGKTDAAVHARNK